MEERGGKFMVANPQFQHMSPKEYLEWEATQELRYEYIDGEVVAMTGGTKPHNRIAGNLYTALDGFLGGGCDVYIADVKVQISPSGPYHYPDVVVTCDSRDRESKDLVEYPCLIVEVLSPSTAAFDRGKKFTRYRQLTTLTEYVLIESEEIGVECFRRNEEGLWVLHPYGAGETLMLESVGFSIPVETLYRQVRFDAKEGELEP
jgi:Uma2 family endonuclease